MTAATAAWAAAGFASVVYLVRYCNAEASLTRSLAKTSAIVFVWVAVFLMGGGPSLLLAIGLCALGDLLLSLDQEKAFLGGVGAFAAGHVGFVVHMLSLETSEAVRLLEPMRAAAILALVLFGMTMARLLWPRAGNFRFAVAAYIPVILSMGVAALTLPAEGWIGVSLVGAALFMFSDTVLAAEMFLIDEESRMHRWTPFVVWPTYWLAVVLLGLALS